LESIRAVPNINLGKSSDQIPKPACFGHFEGHFPDPISKPFWKKSMEFPTGQNQYMLHDTTSTDRCFNAVLSWLFSACASGAASKIPLTELVTESYGVMGPL